MIFYTYYTLRYFVWPFCFLLLLKHVLQGLHYTKDVGINEIVQVNLWLSQGEWFCEFSYQTSEKDNKRVIIQHKCVFGNSYTNLNKFRSLSTCGNMKAIHFKIYDIMRNERSHLLSFVYKKGFKKNTYITYKRTLMFSWMRHQTANYLFSDVMSIIMLQCRIYCTRVGNKCSYYLKCFHSLKKSDTLLKIRIYFRYSLSSFFFVRKHITIASLKIDNLIILMKR